MLINSLRFLIAIAILAPVSYLDIKYRSVGNIYWLITGTIALPLLLINSTINELVFVGIAVIISYVFYIAKEMRAADTKAIWAFALLLPCRPFTPLIPIFPSYVFPIVLLMSSLLLAIFFSLITKKKHLPFITFILLGLIFSAIFIG